MLDTKEILGRILRNTISDPKHLQRSLRVLASCRPPQDPVQLLLNKGLLTPAQASQVRKSLRRFTIRRQRQTRRRTRHSYPAEHHTDILLAKLLLREKLLTVEQINEVFARKIELQREGTRTSIGEILVQGWFISEELYERMRTKAQALVRAGEDITVGHAGLGPLIIHYSTPPSLLCGYQITGVPHLLIFEEIGQGGMAVVYKGLSLKTKQVVALKILHENEQLSPQALARFHREVKAARKLSHPHIIRFYESLQSGKTHIFTMQFIDGPSLETLIKQNGLSVQESCRLFISICDAIAYAHSCNILHRDLKPSNILVEHNQRPIVTDFGLAKEIGKDMSITGADTILGTPMFMSPEHIRGQIDKRSEVYNLGALLYNMVTGVAPYTKPTFMQVIQAVLEHDLTPPRCLNPQLDKQLEKIILKAMAHQKIDRFQSVRECQQAVVQYLASPPAAQHPSPTWCPRMLTWWRKLMDKCCRSFGTGRIRKTQERD